MPQWCDRQPDRHLNNKRKNNFSDYSKNVKLIRTPKSIRSIRKDCVLAFREDCQVKESGLHFCLIQQGGVECGREVDLPVKAGKVGHDPFRLVGHHDKLELE